MAFVKHIGKHGDRKVAVVFKEVPNEEHMCLVIYPDTLPTPIHDSVMKVLESDIGQTAENLADALFRNLTPDGRPILEVLHREGMIKKVQTNQVVMTPNPSSHVKLDELNKILGEMKQGEEAIRRLADVDANAGLVDPAAARRAKAMAMAADQTAAAMDEKALASDLMSQANRMAQEAKMLLAESDRLMKEAAQVSGVKASSETVTKTRGRPRKAAENVAA